MSKTFAQFILCLVQEAFHTTWLDNEFTQNIQILMNPLQSGWIVLKVKYDSLAVHSHSGCNEPGDTGNKWKKQVFAWTMFHAA